MKRRIAPRARTSSRATLGPSRARLSAAAQLRKLTVAAFLAIALVLLFAETGGQAAPEDDDALPYSKGFLVTGDYVVGGVDLNETDNPIDVNGFSTGTINMPASPCPAGQRCDPVPANADVIAAYLLWETLTVAIQDDSTTPVNESIVAAEGVQFRGHDIDIQDVWTVKTSTDPGSSTTPCWGTGQPLTRHIFRADVLRFLPMLLDKDGYETGRFLVNDADLVSNGFPLHTVKLPVRTGNEIPESAGASLLVVYRKPSEPLRKIVIYDGIYTQLDITTPMVQTLQGFYLSADVGSAKFTHITASGQPNQNDKIEFQAGEGFNVKGVWADPFAAGSASQRAWANPTYDVSSLMRPGTNSGVYGETVKTRVYHDPTNGGNDCLTWGAVILSTAVADEDSSGANLPPGDGLPDGLEDAAAGLKDPDGKELPNLNAMGADSLEKDIFIEVNATWAEAGTSYGSLNAPYDISSPLCDPSNQQDPDCIWSVTDADGHTHMPTPEVLKKVGDAYKARGIRPHFDVGPVGDPNDCEGSPGYHCLESVLHPDWVDDYTALVGPTVNGAVLSDEYLVGANDASLARGGEIIKETNCEVQDLNGTPNPFCHFPDYPGTVLWKIGVQVHRDAMVDDLGRELTVVPVQVSEGQYEYTLQDPDGVEFDWSNHAQRRRFDPKRKGLFRYLLYAHSRANPKSLPCLEDGHPAPYESVNETTGVGSCMPDPNPEPDPTKFGPNPDFKALEYHVPSSASGIADLPGGDLLVTLGQWEDFVGRPFAQAGTTFHELGHNLELWHGGLPAILGNANTATYIEPNCKPNYLSSMSYLFQVNGLFDDDDVIHLDYSGAVHGGNALNFTAINETAVLNDAALSPVPSYQPAWFAPADSPLAAMLEVSPALRFCTGEKFGSGSLQNPVALARVHAESATDPIDWDGDPQTLNSASWAFPDVNFDGTLNGPSGLLKGFNDWANLRLDQIGAVPTGALPGSLEGLDDAALIFWNDGGLLGGRGGLLGGRGGLLGGRGGLLGGRGGLLGGRGGVWHEGGLLGGRGGLLGGRGGLLGGRGGLLGGRGGQDGEITHKLANDLGKTRPHGLSLCNIGTPDCADADPFTLEFHRVRGSFHAPPFGTFTGYEVQRKTASAGDETFVTIQTDVVLDTVTNKLTFIDDTELADGVYCKSIRENDEDCEYAYRVRGLATDGNTGWSQQTESTTVTPVNDAPLVSVPVQPPSGEDFYTMTNKQTLKKSAAQGVLINDRDRDSPSAFLGRKVVAVVIQPTKGTLVMDATGAFTYQLLKSNQGSFVGVDTFTYTADDGDGPTVPLSAPSREVTVTITITKK